MIEKHNSVFSISLNFIRVLSLQIMTMFFISCLLLLCFLFINYILYKKYTYKKCLKNIPGPKPHFILGNIKDVMFLKRTEYLDFASKMHREYGTIIKITAGPIHPGIFTSDAKFLEFLLSSNKLIDKSKYYSYLKPWLGTGLLTATGPKWKKHRRMLTPAFHFSILENFIEVFESVGNIFIQKLEAEVGKPSVNICPIITLCTLDVICETAMDIKLNAQDNKNAEYVQSVKTMCTIFIDRIISPLSYVAYPLTKLYYKQKQALKVLHNHTNSVIDKRIAEKSKGLCDDSKKKKKSNFLDILLETTVDGAPLSRSDIREEVDTFMFEGHDTTSATIAFTLFSLATNPDIQNNVFEEQKTIFDSLNEAKATIVELQQMKYLELVIKESLRLYPPIPYLGRQLSENVEWGENLFPKGLNILISVYDIHRNPQFYPDPLKFIPERFINTVKYSPYVYLPFSAGPRNCIGQKFAMLEMKSLLSKVIRNFELTPATPNHEIQLVPNILLESANGVCISFKKRV